MYRNYSHEMFDDYARQRVIYFVCFGLLLLASYALIYVPFIQRMQRETVRTRSLVFVVPPNMIKQHKAILNYIKTTVKTDFHLLP